MTALLWIVGGLAGLFVAWFLLKAVLSFAVPERVSGLALLKQELKKNGTRYEHLPDAFFEECVEFAITVADGKARLLGQGAVARKAELVGTIESIAYVADQWQRGTQSAALTGGDNAYRNIFEKYELRTKTNA